LFFTYKTHYTDNLHPDYFALRKKEDIHKKATNINDLLQSHKIKEKVTEYNNKIEQLNRIDKDVLFQEINKIYYDTPKDPLSLRGNCILSPPHSRIYVF
jgi:hypothetical protein